MQGRWSVQKTVVCGCTSSFIRVLSWSWTPRLTILSTQRVYSGVLYHCLHCPSWRHHAADVLAHVSTDMFNLSLLLSVVPSCFKSNTIIPVLKKPSVSSLNDDCPVALTSMVISIQSKLISHLHCLLHLTLFRLPTGQIDPQIMQQCWLCTPPFTTWTIRTHMCGCQWSHTLFILLWSGRQYRSSKAHSGRFRNSFYLQAIGLLNCWYWTVWTW